MVTYRLLYCEENRNIAMRYRKKKTIIIEIMNKYNYQICSTSKF